MVLWDWTGSDLLPGIFGMRYPGKSVSLTMTLQRVRCRMARTSRTPRFLLAVLLLPLVAAVAAVGFLGYRFLARTRPFGGAAAEG